MGDRDGGMSSIESAVDVDHSIQNSIASAGFAVKAGGRRGSGDARGCHLPGDEGSRMLDRLTRRSGLRHLQYRAARLRCRIPGLSCATGRRL